MSFLHLALALVLFGAAATACAKPTPLLGSIEIQGSPALLGVISDSAGRFAETHPLVRFKVSLTGSSDGIGLLCDGLAPLASAARDLTQTERASCSDGGITPIKLLIGRNAVVLVTRPADGPPRCLSLEALYALLGVESFGLNTWEGSPLLPEAEKQLIPPGPLSVIGPPESSGVMEVIAEQGLGQEASARNVEPRPRGDYTQFASEALVRDASIRTPGSLGILTLAGLKIKGRALSPISINTGDDCIEPSERNIQSSRYPLTRPSYLFVSKQAALSNRSVKEFVDLILDADTESAIKRSGDILPTKAEAAEARNTWLANLVKGGSNK